MSSRAHALALAAAAGIVAGLGCKSTNVIAAEAPVEIPNLEVAREAPSAETTSSPRHAQVAVADPIERQPNCCKGHNECKGKGNCKVDAMNECKGQNDCKGRGGCKSSACPGEPAADSCGPGKNQCKGLGNCKTNRHACKGMNPCKALGGCSAAHCNP